LNLMSLLCYHNTKRRMWESVAVGDHGGFLARLISAIVVVAACFCAPAHADRRIALVIGNDRYPSLAADAQLRKAINDAQAVGEALERIGFQVIRGTNLARQGMIDKLSELTSRLEPGDTAAFFYAGHGVSIGGVNYLVPSDVPPVTPDGELRVRGASISEGDVVAELQNKGVRVALLVLDACRDNPFPRSPTRAIGNTRGLTDARPARGIFTIYSAGIGQTALDRLGANDSSSNSVFTRVFVERLGSPGVDLSGLAIEVRERVAELALAAKDDAGRPAPHEQTPAYYDQTVGGRIYLAGLPKPTAVVVPAADEVAWSFVKDTQEPDQLRRFVEQFPTSKRRDEATIRLAEIERERMEKVAVIAPPVLPSVPPRPAQVTPAMMVPPTVPDSSSPCGGGPMMVSWSSRSEEPLSAAEECLLNPKDSFKECDKCPEMVVVPAGTFMMGSPDSEKERLANEGPQHQVTFARPFAVGRFAVTFDEWDACVAAGGCNGYKPSDRGWGRGRHPVINVSWNDAKAYVAWLSDKTGKSYRLLSEAEREYVTRAASLTPFWWGSSISPQQANYNGTYTYAGSPKGQNRKRTIAVDSFQPNPWGLYQVHGNVWDWTEDCYHDSYVGAPADGSAWMVGDCKLRTLRGGSLFNAPGFLRAAVRGTGTPVNRNDPFGFSIRVGRTLIP
jgi:formylglycine-generating enzyme required for sulfatase activity